MNGTFNGQILVEKLVKLNISQQSIETLSHWCIFHRTNARQVVETWNEQFHCSPREQRLSFLYLANHILQTSRQKGSEFVGEFWKVLPDALSDVIENGDEFGRNAALRMINIWEERKVFGSGGKILKEQVMGRNMVNSNRNGKYSNIKPKQSVGNILEKIISSYDAVYDGSVDEEALLRKCKTAVVYVDKVDKEIGGDYSSGKLDESEYAELQGQHGILRKCIEQLRAAESSRSTLVSQIKEALEEQELKLDQVRTQLQAAQAQSEQAEKICQQLLNSNEERLVAEQGSKEIITFSDMPSSFTPETQAASGEEQSVPVMYTPRALPLPNNSSSIVEEDSRKSAAAAVAAKLAASTSSAQMLTFVLSSLASESMIGSQLNESPGGDYPAEKRAKIENGPTSSAQQPQHSQPPPPHFPHSGSLQNVTTTSQQLTQLQPPLLPSSSSSPISNPGPTFQQPPLTSVPPPPAQFMQTAGSMTSVPYSYGLAQQRPPPSLPSFSVTGPPPPPLPSFSVTGPPPPTTGMSPFSSPNPYQNFQGSEGGFYSHSSAGLSSNFPAVDLHLSS